MEFRASLDAEMKRLQQKGLGSQHKQAEPITEEEEDLYCGEKGNSETIIPLHYCRPDDY